MRWGFAAVALVASAAQAEPIPAPVAAMIEAAAGDAAKLGVVADIAKQTNPASAAEIDARVAEINAAQAKAREEKLASQGLMDGWSGQGEAGGFFSTGNTENRGVAVGVTVTKETRSWKHSVRALVDYQENEGVTSRERYFAGYEGNWKFSRRGYVLLALGYERDPFTGFNSRFSESIGIGYRVIDSKRLSVALEAGPSLRQTRFTDGVNDNVLAARGALNAKWIINDALTFTQNASIFHDEFNTSVYALSALTARLSGKLSARFSFQFNSESDPPAGRETVDTVTRATLVYSF
jgi:putative salt-induced outer membrane protein